MTDELAPLEAHLYISSKLRMHLYLLRLAHALDVEPPQALGHLLAFLWRVIADHRDGDLTTASDEWLATAMGWEGDSAQARRALLRSGFVVATPDNAVHVFDWNEWRAGLYKVHTARLPRNEWQALRQWVFARDDNTCRYCGATGADVRLECDHVTPVSRGGANDLANLVTACSTCNASKHAKTLEEWRP